MNRTADSVRTDAVRRVRSELKSLPAATVRRRFQINRATRSNPEASIDVSAQGINLQRFGARQTAKGVTVVVKGARKLIPHAFIARGRGGSLLVFRRERGAWRYPIEALFGPDVFDVLKNHLVAVLAEGGDTLAKNLEHEIDYLLSGGSG